MERVKSLRQEAIDLRDIAERCRDHRDFHQQVLALAQRCEDLADAFGDRLEKYGAVPFRHSP